MSDYTSLRVKGKVKEKYACLVTDLHRQGLTWSELAQEYPQYGFLTTYAGVNKADFIPEGVLMGEPSHWTETARSSHSRPLPTEGFDNTFDGETRLWSFQCSVNDYKDTVDKFFELILGELLEESYHIERHLESKNTSIMYELKEGKLTQLTEVSHE